MVNYVHVAGSVMRDAVPTGNDSAMFFCLRVGDGDDMVLVDCVMMPALFEQCDWHLERGEALDVEGKLTYRTWTDQLGRKRSGMEVMVENISFFEEA